MASSLPFSGAKAKVKLSRTTKDSGPNFNWLNTNNGSHSIIELSLLSVLRRIPYFWRGSTTGLQSPGPNTSLVLAAELSRTGANYSHALTNQTLVPGPCTQNERADICSPPPPHEVAGLSSSSCCFSGQPPQNQAFGWVTPFEEFSEVSKERKRKCVQQPRWSQLRCREPRFDDGNSHASVETSATRSLDWSDPAPMRYDRKKIE